MRGSTVRSQLVDRERDELGVFPVNKQKRGAPCRLYVSKIITSTSQLPTPGPPRRDLEGKIRFWRV